MPAQATSGSECCTAARAGKTNLDSVQKKHKRDRETVVLLGWTTRERAVRAHADDRKPQAKAGANRRPGLNVS